MQWGETGTPTEQRATCTLPIAYTSWYKASALGHIGWVYNSNDTNGLVWGESTLTKVIFKTFDTSSPSIMFITIGI